MIPVLQVDQQGCMRAAIASLLERQLFDIPDFNKHDDQQKAWKAMQDWLKGRGYFFLEVQLPKDVPWLPVPFPAYCLLFGESPDHPGTKHCVVGVCQGADIMQIHDPSPSQNGLANGLVEAIGFLVPRDPSKMYQAANGAKPKIILPSPKASSAELL